MRYSSFGISYRQLAIVGVMVTGGFLASLNQTLLSPVLPSIMRDLSINAATGQWLTSIFLLVNGIMIPCTAFLTERFTTRQLYLSSMVLFMCGTLLAGVSPTFALLLTARVLQAMGCGVLMPLLMTVILTVFPRSQRGRAMGILGLVMSVGPALGPSIAGWIVDTHHWHVVFLALTPLIALDIIMAFFMMGNLGEPTRPQLDVPSLILSSIGFGALLYGFSMVGTLGWMNVVTWGSVAVATVALTIFAKRQLVLETPLLNLRVLNNKQFYYGTILGMLINAALIFGGILTPIYLQQVNGFSALDSALLMLPATIIMAILSPIVGTIFDRHGARTLSLVGLGLLTVGTFLYMTFEVGSSYWYLLVIYTVRLTGIALVMMPINTWAMQTLTLAEIPHGNALNNTLRQVAGSIGTALLVSIMTIVSTQTAAEGFAQSTMHGFRAAFFCGGLLMIVAWVLSFVKMRRP